MPMRQLATLDQACAHGSADFFALMTIPVCDNFPYTQQTSKVSVQKGPNTIPSHIQCTAKSTSAIALALV